MEKTDQEIVDAIKAASRALNGALGDAERNGLRVDVNLIDATQIHSVWPIRFVSVLAYRTIEPSDELISIS